MKVILKTLLFLLIVLILSQCRKDEPVPVVEEILIPDDNFLTALIEEDVDTNGDGKISPEEAIVRTSFLDVSKKSISDLTGIEAFGNLMSLDCSNNLLTNLDVSNNSALGWLDCGYNQLTTLDVNIVLKLLYCSSNQLSTLDVSNNTALGVLSCSSNQLTSLDVSNNTALYYLSFEYNQLTTLNVLNNTGLKVLGCSDNQLNTLGVSNNIALQWLGCSDNPLINLDVSNNNALEDLRIAEIPSLNKVCVWEMPFPPAGVEVDTTGSHNVYFTTDCN